MSTLSNVERGKWIRQKLRKDPQWAVGHLELGFTELASVDDNSSQDQLRSIETAKLSALAVLTLLSEREKSDSLVSRAQRLLDEAEKYLKQPETAPTQGNLTSRNS